MKYSITIVLYATLMGNMGVLGSKLNGKSIRGNDHGDRDLQEAFPQRKEVPQSYRLKQRWKLASQAAMPSIPQTPTISPSSKVKAPASSAGLYTLAKTPTVTPPSVFPPTPPPSHAPSKFPTRPPTPPPTPPPTAPPTPPPTEPPTPPPTPPPTKPPTPPPTRPPTHRPTPSPTKPPTPQPTRHPTPSPTKPPTDAPTQKPTLPPQNNSGSFMLRLYWQSSYFWQETHAETWWCLECTKCDEFSLGDGPNHGCIVPGDDGSSCREGHAIWIRKCTDTRRNYKWQVLKNPGSGDQIRAVGSNLCLSTIGNRFVEMRQCNSGSENQLFKPIDNINQFEIRPYYQRNWSMSDAKCLSQMHHPKDKELVGLHQCQTAKAHETLYWEDYYR